MRQVGPTDAETESSKKNEMMHSDKVPDRWQAISASLI